MAFFSKTLPILKADDTLPKVARYEDPNIEYNPTIFHSRPDNKISFYKHRSRRSPARRLDEGGAATAKDGATEANVGGQEAEDSSEAHSEAASPRAARQGRAGGSGDGGWCDDSHGVFCMLFNAFRATTSVAGIGGGGDRGGGESGEGKSHVDRLGDSDVAASSSSGGGSSSAVANSLDAPMTPCPSAVEYVTPVFAKNYQGVWRYVVQIPYEGYFTQTVEVVKCL